MTDNQESTSTNQEDRELGRRRLIKALGTSAGGIVVAFQWSKPIVESVVVPLHAQGSPQALVPFLGCSPSPQSGTQIALGFVLTVNARIEVSSASPGESVPPGEHIVARWTCGPTGRETLLDTQTLTTTSAATLGSPAIEASTLTVDNRCQSGDIVQVGLTWDPSPGVPLDPGVTTPLTTQDPAAPGGEPCFWPLLETF